MKTYQIYGHLSVEFFVEAETEDEAIYKALEGQVKPSSEEYIDWNVADIHNGEYWESEVRKWTN